MVVSYGAWRVDMRASPSALLNSFENVFYLLFYSDLLFVKPTIPSPYQPYHPTDYVTNAKRIGSEMVKIVRGH